MKIHLHNLKRVVAIALALCASLGMLFASANLALAQTDAVGRPVQGLSVSPFILERQMERGQTLKDTIEVTNTTDRALPVDISIKDFTAGGDNGQQIFYEPGEGDQTYALSKWLKVQNNPKLSLKPHEKTQIDFTITAPADAEDGGHYGSIQFAFTAPKVEGSAVEVSQKIAAIILVKLGKTNEEGNINSFRPAHSVYESAPVTLRTRFHNTGNVHVKPRGSITIKNMFGKKVGTTLVNPNGSNVLPNSERLFESSWTDKFAFGRYTASVELVYGDSGQVVRAETSFWVIPYKLVGLIALGLFLVIFALTYGIRRYNRWFMAKLLEQNKPTRKPRTQNK